MYPSRILRATHGKPNITGFDIRKFVQSAGQPKYDPWERAEAWRYHGIFSRWNRLGRAFPGLGIATFAFVIYVAIENRYLKDKHHGEEHHGEEPHGEEKEHH
ncbi:NADH-ubiquinone oxidoreductase B12 subunit family-domain-containing protein [Whalleya microplaca]|nr:NADH-ubiquinone oxidoreductase B12 subunit family-domain-containing protein [Whalleya microplaca]